MAKINPNETTNENNRPRTSTYKISKAEDRSALLIADFSSTDHPRKIYDSPYAIGWTFLVTEAFRDALDIKYTAATIDGETLNRWTQGRCYNFKEGDTIHAACDGFDLIVQVVSATPASQGAIEIKIDGDEYQKNGQIDIKQSKGNPGTVRFQFIGKRDESGKTIDFYCTQDEFINLLKNGIFTPLNEREEVSIYSLFPELSSSRVLKNNTM